jgi:hypothetical protein
MLEGPDGCERRYYLNYYGANNGWRADGSPDAQLAWRLKRLTTLYMALGQAVHHRARELATAYLLRATPPTLEMALRRTRSDLNSLWRSSRDRDGFLRNPKRFPMLQAVYYGRSIDVEQLARIQDRLTRCLTHLYACPLWNELLTLPATDILVVEELASFLVDGVKVYVQPDLVYRSLQDGLWTVVDWKSGATTGLREQLALYALYVRDHLRLPLADGRVRCRVVKLGEGSELGYWVTPEDMAAAESRIRAGVERMRSLLADPVANVPLPREHFRLAENRAACESCRFLEMCRVELKATSPGERGDPGPLADY